MSVKKLLVLTAGVAVMSATAAMAGGPDHMAMPAQPMFQNSIYLDGHVGYAQADWSANNTSGLIGANGAAAFTPNNNGNGGFTAGVDMGYNFTQNIALEAGWFYLPTVGANGTGVAYAGHPVAETTDVASVRSWALYAAAKLSVALMDSFDLFGKIGVGYRNLNYSANIANSASAAGLSGATGTGHYWLPLFATGLEYTLGSWLFGAQYMYITGNTQVNSAVSPIGAPDAAPSASLYTAFVGYKFNV